LDREVERNNDKRALPIAADNQDIRGFEPRIKLIECAGADFDFDSPVETEQGEADVRAGFVHRTNFLGAKAMALKKLRELPLEPRALIARFAAAHGRTSPL
jgi:hypothetical protein